MTAEFTEKVLRDAPYVCRILSFFLDFCTINKIYNDIYYLILQCYIINNDRYCQTHKKNKIMRRKNKIYREQYKGDTFAVLITQIST